MYLSGATNLSFFLQIKGIDLFYFPLLYATIHQSSDLTGGKYRYATHQSKEEHLLIRAQGGLRIGGIMGGIGGGLRGDGRRCA